MSSGRPAPDLQAVREELEAIDDRLLALLAERMARAETVALSKLDTAWPFRDPEREERLLLRLRRRAVEAGLDPHEIERLYRVILDMSVARQQVFVREREVAPLRVAYQGAEGSYSHLTAQRAYSGRSGGVLLTGHESFRGAADAVVAGDADLALLPIENSTAGSINETYDLLAEGRLRITGERVTAIEHCLLALPGTAIAGLRTVLSHPQALRQCDGFFCAHPELRAREEYDTAGAARKVRESGDRTLAAIASASAAGTYGLEILARGIQSEATNATRFVEVALHPIPVPPDRPVKTSLVLTLAAERPGALGEVLSELARRGLNLTKLESRPIPGSRWSYRFYLDVEGHASSDRFREALEAVAPSTAELVVLGTYPVAIG
ncbi:MAG: prephenate dehydratase [Thermoanaerobaculia bacterium]